MDNEGSSTSDTDVGASISVGNSGSTDVQLSKEKVARVQRALKKLGTSPSYKVTGNVVPSMFLRKIKMMKQRLM